MRARLLYYETNMVYHLFMFLSKLTEKLAARHHYIAIECAKILKENSNASSNDNF